ncbi:DUF7620 family protein [Streptomyces platensis]|uniref:DUF7620 family protein n=1 Tax=Streptomyces platensis TaxID=58346 RepID=UPI003D9F7035
MSWTLCPSGGRCRVTRWTRLLCVRRRGRPTPGQKAAQRAVERAQAARIEAEERRPEVDEATDKLRRLRERNHFAEMFRSAIEGTPR